MLHSNRAALALGLAWAALGAAGCKSQDLPIGGDGSSASALLVAGWEGYVENFHFRSGSDVVRIDITSVQGTAIDGTVRFGSGPDLPVATDPHVGYPTGPSSGLSYDVQLPYEGFDFPIRNAQLTDHRLRFSIATKEVWNHWCEIQTPYPFPSGTGQYMCGDNYGTMASSSGCALQLDVNTTEAIDCGYLALCGGHICSSFAPGNQNVGNEIDFDLAVDQQQANGSATLDGMINVRLTRSN